MSSTRRTRERFRAWYRKPAAAAAEAAEAAEAAGVAGVADAAEAAAAAGCRGELAASARPDNFTITLTNARRHGRVRQGRPGLLVSSFHHCPSAYAGACAHDRQVGLQPHRET